METVNNLPPISDWPDEIVEMFRCMEVVIGTHAAYHAMSALLVRCAGQYTYWPVFGDYKHDCRNRAILAAINAGTPIADVAETYGVARSTVYRIKNSFPL